MAPGGIAGGGGRRGKKFPVYRTAPVANIQKAKQTSQEYYEKN